LHADLAAPAHGIRQNKNVREKERKKEREGAMGTVITVGGRRLHRSRLSKR